MYINEEEAMEDAGKKFKVGEVYIATPAMDGQPRKLGVVIGKCGNTLQVAFVDELVMGEAEELEGRDFAALDTRIGRYNMSACARAAAKDAAIVNDILRAQCGDLDVLRGLGRRSA